MADAPRKKPSLLARVLPAIVGIGVLVTIPGIIAMTCHRDSKLREARDAFLFEVAASDPDAAYGLLSTERRRAMTRVQFEEFIDHPAFRSNDGTYEPPYEYHPGYCMDGMVPADGGDWYMQLFFLEEEGQMRVHSLALQRPTRVHLATILPECGFWKGTLRGYRGPPPERSTRSTRAN